jgi:SAM-dependent methyltransferase
MVDRTSQMKLLVQHYVGYAATHLVRLGVDTGLFAALAANNEPVSSAELALKMGFDGSYTEHFLRAATSVGLVEADRARGGFRLAPHMAALLAEPESYRYMGAMAHLYILAGRDFARMPEFLRTGATRTFQDHDDALVAAASDATEGIAQFLVRAIVPRLPGMRGRDDVHALDVGCGAGAVVVALARLFPRGRVIGIDIEPRLVARAMARIAEAGAQRASEVRVAPAEAITGEALFDLITMVQVLHETKPEYRPAILERIEAALRPGGFLVIVDEPYPNALEDLGGAPAAVLTQFIEIFMGNVLLSPDEQRAMVEAAGLEVLSQMVPPPGLICVTVAQKGAAVNNV